MIEFKSGEEVVAFGRVVQDASPDFTVLGLGLYPVDHDFTKSKKPLHFLPSSQSAAMFARTVAKSIVRHGNDDVSVVYNPTDNRFGSGMDVATLVGFLDGSLRSVPAEIDWTNVFFPEEL